MTKLTKTVRIMFPPYIGFRAELSRVHPFTHVSYLGANILGLRTLSTRMFFLGGVRDLELLPLGSLREMYKESPKIANRITENCKSGESGFFELSFLFI